MPKFVISPHFRLHEWVAEEKGYFSAEGLDYEFRDVFEDHATPDKVGAYQLRKGPRHQRELRLPLDGQRRGLVGHGKLYADAYSVSPAAVFVPPEFADQGSRGSGRRADLGRLPVGQPLFDDPGARAVHAAQGHQALLRRRHPVPPLEKLIDRQVPAAAVFSGPYYFLEQLGFRKVIDTTFMMASMITGDPDREDVKKYFPALRLAQRDIDLRPELYTQHYRNEFPQALPVEMDTRRWGPGERIVFEPYTKEVFEDSFRWIRERGIFEDGAMGEGKYEDACVSLTA